MAQPITLRNVYLVTTPQPHMQSYELCAAVAALAEELGRGDLAAAMHREAERSAAATSLVCVVGEFKQGKSSLINAVVGSDVCPVDDDLATSAVTVVEHGDRVSALVERRDEDGPSTFAIELDAVPDWVTEWNNPDNEKQVDRVRLSIPNPLLARGLTLVDTPGAGGLGAGHAAATMGFLPFADALLFVSDASAELSAPEVEFLVDAVARCPLVVMAQTKTDLYGEWRRIVDLNRAHLASAGLQIPIVGLSSVVRRAALTAKDKELNSRSGFAELFGLLDSTVLATARARNDDRVQIQVQGALDQIATSIASEMSALAEPSRNSEMLEQLTRSREQLEHLKGPAARWQIRLADLWAELAATLSHDFRRGLRGVTQMVDDELEGLKNAREWDDFGRRAQTEVGRVVADLFEDLMARTAESRDTVLQLVRDEEPDLELLASDGFEIDVAQTWSARQPTLQGAGVLRRAGRGANEVVDSLKGAQGGLMVLSLLQTAIPAAGLAVVLANPFLLAGLGLWSGGRTLFEQRKRRIAQQRQQVRIAIAKMVDEVSFEVGDQMAAMLRRQQATLREQLNERFNQLLRTSAELATQAQQNATMSEAEAERRRAELARIAARVSALQADRTTLAPAMPAPK